MTKFANNYQETDVVYYRPRAPKKLQGDALVEARKLSYEQLTMTKRNRRLTKSEEAHLIKLEKFLARYRKLN